MASRHERKALGAAEYFTTKPTARNFLFSSYRKGSTGTGKKPNLS
jgi:hypothetical protein